MMWKGLLYHVCPVVGASFDFVQGGGEGCMCLDGVYLCVQMG